VRFKKQVYLDPQELKQDISGEKNVVWTNGCFDLLHVGHLHSLKEAAQYGDILIVGLNSDESVKQLKGLGRPIYTEQDRANLLSSLGFVDAVLMFNGLNPMEELKIIKPDIFAKGAEYDLSQLPEAQLVSNYGGKVVSLSLIDSISTSDIINRIKSL